MPKTREKAILRLNTCLKKFWIKGIKNHEYLSVWPLWPQEVHKGVTQYFLYEKDMKKLYSTDLIEKMLAAYVATLDFAAELWNRPYNKATYERAGISVLGAQQKIKITLTGNIMKFYKIKAKEENEYIAVTRMKASMSSMIRSASI